jgi:hypothetical protein
MRFFALSGAVGVTEGWPPLFIRNERPSDIRDCWFPDRGALAGTGTRFVSPLNRIAVVFCGALGRKWHIAVTALNVSVDRLTNARTILTDEAIGDQVDDEIELGRLLDWKVSWFRPAQNLVDVLFHRPRSEI